MQIVFAHYHLNPGGVTQVIVNQIRALATLPSAARPSRIGVLYGGRNAGWPAELLPEDSTVEVVVLPLPELEYDDLQAKHVDSPETDSSSRQLATAVLHKLQEGGFTADQTLLHIHNHALGKNVAWPGSLAELLRQGYRLLLQIHDFAEDFRPANYRTMTQALAADRPEQLAGQLYGSSPAVHYATLTQRDGNLLRQAGVAEEQLHLLPNPGSEFANLPPYKQVAQPVRQQLGLPEDARLVLYPVRGIRRKNVGELLLYAAISPTNTWHAITLAPKNPVELPSFQRWQALAEELQLRCLFNTCGEGTLPYLDMLAASDCLITTSVAEGFGMVFLEAWLAGKPLIGRNLPEITADFEAAGLRFPHLRDRLEVPLAWLASRPALATALEEAYRWACQEYGVDCAPQELERAHELVATEQETIDFALLPGTFQQEVIRHVAAASEAARPETAREELERYNPGWTTVLGELSTSGELLAANAAVVRSNYSLERIGQRLDEVYTALANSPVATSSEETLWQPLPHGNTILTTFLQLDRLHAIRFEP